MLHIAWMILKIIGIFILVLLGLLLFFLLAGLFVPLRYRLGAEKHGEEWRAGGSISWLFHAVFVTVSYDGEKPSYECRLLGIPLFRVKKWWDGKRGSGKIKKKKRSPAGKTPYCPEAEAQDPGPRAGDSHPYDGAGEKKSISFAGDGGDDDSGKQFPERASGEEQDSREKKKNIFSRIMDKIRALLSLPRKIRFTIRENYGKIKEWKSILQSDDVKHLKKTGIDKTRASWGHIRPRKIRGNIIFGFEDPAHTGETLGLLAILYPMFPRKLSVTPMFTEKILEGWLEMRGRIYGVFFLITTLQVLFDGHTIPIIKKFMRKEA